MKKIKLEGLSETIEVHDWANYVVRQPNGLIREYAVKPEQEEDGFYSPLTGRYAVASIPTRLWDIRPTVPPVEGHRFQLRSGTVVRIPYDSVLTWNEEGKHTLSERDDLIKDLGPISPVTGPGWYISRDGRLIQVWTTEAPFEDYPVRGCLRLSKDPVHKWVNASWTLSGEVTSNEENEDDILRPAREDEIPE